MTQQKIKELEEMINSFPPTYDLIKKAIHSKIAELKYSIDHEYTPRWRSIPWNVEDFKGRAEQLKEANPKKNYIFDETKFEDALEQMIKKHDANLGISWETVDIYLREYCLAEE